MSEKFGITPVELKAFHNTRCELKDLIGGNDFPKHLNEILIDENWKEVSIELIKSDDDKEVEKIEFEHQARYRCEQNNLILIDGKPSFSAQIKTQYLLSKNKSASNYKLNVQLEDYVTSIQPQNMEEAFDLIKHIELIRDNISFVYHNGKIEKILNFNDLNKKWNIFINETSTSVPFFNELKSKSPEIINDFIENGKKEFSNENIFCDVISKNLFFHLLLDIYNKEKKDEYSFSQMSQIFPEVLLKINVVKTLVCDNENSTTYRLVGNLNKDSVKMNAIKNLYEQLYQPIIKFSFTEFDFIYRITYELEKETNVLLNASVSIKESVKNNYDVITKYELRKVEL